MGRESHTNVSAVTGHPELVTRFNEKTFRLCFSDLKFHTQTIVRLEFLPLTGSPCRTKEDLTAEPIAESLRSLGD